MRIIFSFDKSEYSSLLRWINKCFIVVSRNRLLNKKKFRINQLYDFCCLHYDEVRYWNRLLNKNNFRINQLWDICCLHYDTARFQIMEFDTLELCVNNILLWIIQVHFIFTFTKKNEKKAHAYTNHLKLFHLKLFEFYQIRFPKICVKSVIAFSIFVISNFLLKVCNHIS